jgi:hypothetical protein
VHESPPAAAPAVGPGRIPNAPVSSVRAEPTAAALVPTDNLNNVGGLEGRPLRGGLRSRLFPVGVRSVPVGNDLEVVNDDAHGHVSIECRNL